MHAFKNITLIGSSHISEESIRQVKEGFELIVPDIVAVELDAGRAQGLFHKKKPSKAYLLKALGLGGFLFYIIGEFIQKKLGKIVNIDPGSEMKTALVLAKENKAAVVLIDREIQVTLRRFSRFFRKRELLRMVYDLFFGKKEAISFDLSKLPTEEVVDFAISTVKKRYPSIYKVLIEERDIYMGERLYGLTLAYPDKKILAVVGAGHMKGILENLNKLEAMGKSDLKHNDKF